MKWRLAVTTRGGRIAKTLIFGPQESLRVLVVDDYRATADTISRLVATWGHDVRHAYDGATGMELAAAFRPNVLLLDLVMSGASGLALAQQMQRQARVGNCLLIAVTGRTDAGHRLQCEEAGIDLFLVKPVDLSFLRSLLAVESEYLLRARQYPGAQSFSTRLGQLAPCVSRNNRWGEEEFPEVK